MPKYLIDGELKTISSGGTVWNIGLCHISKHELSKEEHILCMNYLQKSAEQMDSRFITIDIDLMFLFPAGNYYLRLEWLENEIEKLENEKLKGDLGASI